MKNESLQFIILIQSSTEQSTYRSYCTKSWRKTKMDIINLTPVSMDLIVYWKKRQNDKLCNKLTQINLTTMKWKYKKLKFFEAHTGYSVSTVFGQPSTLWHEDPGPRAAESSSSLAIKTWGQNAMLMRKIHCNFKLPILPPSWETAGLAQLQGQHIPTGRREDERTSIICPGVIMKVVSFSLNQMTNYTIALLMSTAPCNLKPGRSTKHRKYLNIFISYS
jgi:hypothetical protein